MKLIFTRIEISLVVLLTLAFSQILKAQTEEEKTDLAAAIQNPIAAMISVPFQNNTDFGLEPGNQFKNVLNIQPVVPGACPDRPTTGRRPALAVLVLHLA